MHAVKPCIARSVVAAPGPGPGPATPPSSGTNRFGDGSQAFGSWMNAGATALGQPDPLSGGPLRDRAGPARTSEPAVSTELVNVITKLRRDERTLDRTLRRALAGHDFSMPQLVALQSLAFKYSQRVELMGKLVDRLTGAVKQTLQMQV